MDLSVVVGRGVGRGRGRGDSAGVKGVGTETGRGNRALVDSTSRGVVVIDGTVFVVVVEVLVLVVVVERSSAIGKNIAILFPHLRIGLCKSNKKERQQLIRKIINYQVT